MRQGMPGDATALAGRSIPDRHGNPGPSPLPPSSHGRRDLPPSGGILAPADGLPPQPRLRDYLPPALRSPARQPVIADELACLIGVLPDTVLEHATSRATSIGIGADIVLISHGEISEFDFLQHFSAYFDIPFTDLDALPRTNCPLSDDRLLDAARSGLLPMQEDGELHIVMAPLQTGAHQLSQLARARGRGEVIRFRLTTRAQLTRFIMLHSAQTLTGRATDALNHAAPSYSAAPRVAAPLGWRTALLALGLILLVVFHLPLALTALDIALALVFAMWIALRVVGAFVRVPQPAATATRRDDRSLPTYTIIAALYHEARAVDGLVRALRNLDYPPEKLDIKLVIEEDDETTAAAIAACRLAAPFEVIVAPPGGPRTKPKALNAALPFGRGAFTVVYDAEDRPEPDQLHKALAAFENNPHLICVQARLSIDNAGDSLLSRMFTAEYAGQFDVLLPGMAALRLPLPLGGSSNHFITDVLREVGAWDPFNVTEDADLGIRLARLNHLCGVIASTTDEEAPTRLGPWLRQRTRWFKGWIQTWAVHMRHPLRLWHDFGVVGFMAFQLIIGGTVLAGLSYPFFAIATLYEFATAALSSSHHFDAYTYLHRTIFFLGIGCSALLGAMGLMRRKLLRHAWILLFLPIHWFLLSLASWRALYQFFFDRYTWEKTEHGMGHRPAQSHRHAARSFAPQD